MLHYTILFYTTLHYTTQYHTTLCIYLLYYTILCYTIHILYYTKYVHKHIPIKHYTILKYTTLYYAYYTVHAIHSVLHILYIYIHSALYQRTKGRTPQGGSPPRGTVVCSFWTQGKIQPQTSSCSYPAIATGHRGNHGNPGAAGLSTAV